MNERRYPMGYIPLTMHELGGISRDIKTNNNEFQDHDSSRDHRVEGEDRRRSSRSRRASAPRRSTNRRHVSKRDPYKSSSPEQRRLRFRKKEQSYGENEDY